MTTDDKQIEKIFKMLDETWAKVHPGKRVCGTDRDGNPCVFLCEDLNTPLGWFKSEAESKAFAEAPTTVEFLSELVKKLVRERTEARTALKEICYVADPALDAFNEQKPVDMAAVLKTTHHWGHHILDP